MRCVRVSIRMIPRQQDAVRIQEYRSAVKRATTALNLLTTDANDQLPHRLHGVQT